MVQRYQYAGKTWTFTDDATPAEMDAEIDAYLAQTPQHQVADAGKPIASSPSLFAKIAPTGIRLASGLAVPVAALLSPAMAGFPLLALAGLGAGAVGAGELAAEGVEVSTGQRQRINPLQVLLQTGLGAIPAASTVTGVKAGLPILKTVLRTLPAEAALGASAAGATESAETGRFPSLGTMAKGAGFGLLGGFFGLGLAGLKRRRLIKKADLARAVATPTAAVDESMRVLLDPTTTLPPMSVNAIRESESVIRDQLRARPSALAEWMGARPTGGVTLAGQPHQVKTDLGPVEAQFSFSLLSPERAAQKIGGGAQTVWTQRLIAPVKDAEEAIFDRQKSWTADVDTLAARWGIKPDSAADVAVRQWAEGQPYNKKALPTQASQIVDAARLQYDEWLEEVNAMRILRGLKVIPRRKDFFTHIRNMNAIEQSLGPLTLLPSMPQSTPRVGKPFFGPAMERTGQRTVAAGQATALAGQPGVMGKIGRVAQRVVETEPHGALAGLRVYGRKTIEHVERLRAATQIESWIDTLPPNAKRYFTDWMQRGVLKIPNAVEQAIRKSPFGDLAVRGAEKLTQGAVGSFIGGSIRTAVIQPSSWALTIGRTGLLNALRGIRHAFDPDIANLRIVKQRTNAFVDLDPTVFRTRPIRRALELASLPMQWLDQMQVRLAASAGRELGKQQGKTGTALLQFADTIASQTQAEVSSTFKAGIQQTRLGRLATPLQTFTLNIFQLLLRDLPLLAKETGRLNAVRHILVGAGAVAAMNALYEDGLGIAAPFQWSDLIPLIGSKIRFGSTSPMLDRLEDTGQILTRTRSRKDAWKIPFFFMGGGGQVIKTVEGARAVQKGFHRYRSRFFPIRGTAEQARAIAFGPFGTKAAQQFFKRQESRR